MRLSYSSDLSDAQWEIVRPFFEAKPNKVGRPCKHSKREIVNAIFYVLQSGCAWRLLPHDFPSWRTVYTEFRDWQNLGIWEKVNAFLVKTWRTKKGKTETPSAAVIDSQSVRTTEKGGHAEDMMEQRKSEEENDISWLTLRDCCSKPELAEVILATKRVLSRF
jgi:putative transposase